jgi:hypothetical protein
MKKTLTTVSFLILFIASISWTQTKQPQETKQPATKLEAFLAEKGELIVKDFYNLGQINGKYGSQIKLDAMVIYKPGEETSKVRGLRIEITEGGEYAQSNTSFLDLEEMDELSKAISYMVDLMTKWQNVNKQYTEVIFSTKGDFQIGFYQKGTEAFSFSSCGYIQKASCYFSSMAALNSIKISIDKGTELLSEK